MKIMATEGAGNVELLSYSVDDLIQGMALMKENNVPPKNIEMTRAEFEDMKKELSARGWLNFKTDRKNNSIFGLPVVIKT